ncbi:MAG: methyltransferase family protein [Myxococcales bacterium]
MSSEATLGQTLFKFRSITPVPIIVICLVLLYFSRATFGPGGAGVDALMDVAGLLLCVLGQALRAWTLGQVPEGTSGQGFQLEAAVLNTTGPYARVRNPLYVGNALITLGLLLIAWDPAVLVIALVFFFGQYFFIIRAEEAFLRGRFGEKFDEFCRKVPRWIPRLTPASDLPLSHRFDWKRALRKEHNPFAAWASGVLVLYGWELWARRPDAFQQRLPGLVAAQVAVLLLFVGIKGWKHQWFGGKARA